MMQREQGRANCVRAVPTPPFVPFPFRSERFGVTVKGSKTVRPHMRCGPTAGYLLPEKCSQVLHHVLPFIPEVVCLFGVGSKIVELARLALMGSFPGRRRPPA